jgi:acetyltransferase-like isoleucine patch superfamily enzyme
MWYILLKINIIVPTAIPQWYIANDYSIIEDNRPIPTGTGNDDVDFADDPWIDGPIRVDFGTNLRSFIIFLNFVVLLLTPSRFGSGVYVNFNCTFLDTSTITIGARTLIGPNCSFYSATHPINAKLRNGTAGPELGFPITVGEDCWFGGNVTVLPNVTIGKGCTIGAGSVVTKDVPAYSVVAGNPARIVRSVATEHQPLDPSRDAESLVEEEAKAIEATLRAMPFMQSTKDRAQDS